MPAWPVLTLVFVDELLATTAAAALPVFSTAAHPRARLPAVRAVLPGGAGARPREHRA